MTGLAVHGRARLPAPAQIEVQGAMKKLLILAMLLPFAAQAAYRCKDEKGLTHIGDVPPPQCANVVLFEVTTSGTILRRIEPTLTGDQVKARQEELARQKEADKAAAEQRRKDMALLATYSAEKDIDTSRDINLKPIEGRIRSAETRTAEVEKRQKELEDEMEFYKAGKGKSGKGKEPPMQLVADLERTRNEKAALARSIVSYGKEMEEVRARYDGDKKRWVELKQMHREGKLDLRDPKEIEASKKVDTTKPGVKKYNLYLVPAN
jgi:hypothetical protein